MYLSSSVYFSLTECVLLNKHKPNVINIINNIIIIIINKNNIATFL